MMFNIEHLHDEKKSLIYKVYPYTILVTSPNENFKQWLAKPAANRNITPVEIEKMMQPSTLKEHSVAILLPIMISIEQFKSFLESQSKTIIESVLKTWKIDLTEWPEERDIKALCTNFNIDMNPMLCGITEDKQGDTSTEHFCMITKIQAKQPYIDWYTSLDTNKTKNKYHGRPSEKVSRESTTICYLCHSINKLEVVEWEDLIRNNYMEMARMWMYLGCQNELLWPKWNDYLSFTRWFEFSLYPNIIDLLK